MARTQLTTEMIEAMMAAETSEVMLTFCTFDHPSWGAPIRLVDYNVAVTSNTFQYTPFPFKIQLPNDEDQGFPVLRFQADNVDQIIIQEFRATTGAVQADVFWALLSDPDVAQAGPFSVEIQGFNYNKQTIEGIMTIEPVLDEPFGVLVMNPSNAPGLF